MKKIFFLTALIASPLFSMDLSDDQTTYRPCVLNEDGKWEYAPSAQSKAAKNKKSEPAFVEMCIVAATHGRIDWLRALWKAGSTYQMCFDVPHAKGVTPLFMACQEGHTETVKWLLETPNVHPEQQLSLYDEKVPCTSLHMAAAKGHAAIVELLMNANAELSSSQHAPKKQTPLHYAVAKGDIPCINAILDKACANDQCLLDEDGNSALSLADQHENPEVFETFQKRKPLIKAAKGGSLTKIRVLLKLKNIDLERRDSETNATAFMWAAGNGQREIVKALAEAGADMLARDKNDDDALDWAREGQNEDFIKELRSVIHTQLAKRVFQGPLLVAPSDTPESTKSEFLGSAF